MERVAGASGSRSQRKLQEDSTSREDCRKTVRPSRAPLMSVQAPEPPEGPGVNLAQLPGQWYPSRPSPAVSAPEVLASLPPSAFPDPP